MHCYEWARYRYKCLMDTYWKPEHVWDMSDYAAMTDAMNLATGRMASYWDAVQGRPNVRR